MFVYTLTRARNLGNASWHASKQPILRHQREPRFQALLRLTNAPSVMSEAWDQTRLREGPGRGRGAVPFYSPLQSLPYQLNGHSRPQNRLVLLAAGGWARGPRRLRGTGGPGYEN